MLHLQIDLHMYLYVHTFCKKSLYHKAKVGKKVFLVHEDAYTVLLVEKDLHELGHVVVLGFVNNLYAFCQFKLNNISNTL